jgi:hypothetical protein
MQSYHLTTPLQSQILSGLHISKELLLEEVTLLLLKRQLAESKMEITYFEKKYQQDFAAFEREFQSNSASFEIENDWLAWKFAEESWAYWQNLLQQAHQ